MKIGILTFHYAHNYGAVLQAYALKTYIETLGHEVFVLDYRNNNIVREYPKKLRPRIPKKFFFNPLCWGWAYEEIERCIFSRKTWEIQYTKFQNFIDGYLLQNNRKDWKTQCEECDKVFFGSDQIWEENIVGKNELVYFGEIDSDARKISYASSCFNPSKFAESNNLKKIKNFDYISTREESLASVIRKAYPTQSVKTVVDPVFLLDRKKYEAIADDKSNDYILFYYVSENNELAKISEYLRIIEGKKVIEIHYYNSKKISNTWQLTDVGPEEFLGLISGAEMIITNSFHGTAFSLIFEKPFWSLSSNVRIVDVLEKFELTDRRIESYEEWREKKNYEIDYAVFDSKMNNLISESKQYIDTALCGE